jgi:hypothetical protein
MNSFKVFRHMVEVEKNIENLLKKLSSFETLSQLIQSEIISEIAIFTNKIENFGIELTSLINLNYHLQFSSLCLAILR